MTVGCTNLLAWWFISVTIYFPLFLSVHAACLSITPSCHLVCSFDTIYHPTDFTVMNEAQNYDVSF